MQGNQGISGVDTVAAAVGAVIGGLVVASTIVIYLGACWALKPIGRIAKSYWKSNFGQPVESAAPTGGATSQNAVTGPLAPPAAETARPEAADLIKTVLLRCGAVAVHLRIFTQARLIKPRVVMRDADLARLHGKQVELAPISFAGTTQDEAEKEAIDRAESLLGAAPDTENAHFSPISSGGNDAPVGDNVSVEPDDKTQAEPPPDPLAPAQKAQPRMRPPRKGLVSYEGVLQRAGVERRTGVKTPYDCYCVTIANEALGEQQLWGTDLERAIEDAGVTAGEPVRISLIGETPVFFNGRSSMKKVWSVEHAGQ